MNTRKLLLEMLSQTPIKLQNQPDLRGVQVGALVFDSRAVQPGDLFFALQGESVDGHRYIPAAVQRGAAAVVGSEDVGDLPAPYLKVADTRLALAHLAAAWNDFPARKLTVIGVTGTDGKTTTSNLLYRMLAQAGIQAGMISTVNAVIGDQVVDTGFHVTTPEAPDVQRYLAQMVAAGLTHVVLESTSHGLAQQRVAACEFDIAVVTNITHEHLDYHKTYEGYREAKGRLFTALAETAAKPQGNPRLAVLNRDDESYAYLDGITPGDKVAYSLDKTRHPQAQVWAEEVVYQPTGTRFTIVTADGRTPVQSHLVGDFNISNCLAAFSAAVLGLGIDPAVAAQGIASLPGVPGRMEVIDLGQDFTAIVDFAHTPNALKVALQTVRKLTAGRVIAVFGSAGLRDRAKRRMMAEVSVGLADLTILTAEDPRTESLDDILAEMAGAAAGAGGVEGSTFLCVPDRGEAIQRAVALAQPGDLVVACGKGHEQSMCFGATEYDWDDRTAMWAALSELLGKEGPKMPYLPTQQ
jgi:UDP-N-acetylmuramoyl-L-alanyl-D-glutamate--2,6-diaminopimelate ligase